MDFPTLQRALSEYFGDDGELLSPEEQSDAWRAIVDGCLDNSYGGLLEELDGLLECSDETILTFLRSAAPAWVCDGPADARHSLNVFYSYVQTSSD